MKRVATIALAVAALASTAALDARAAEVRDLSGLKPSLITDTAISNNDSALVRAAKTTVAARMRDAGRSTGVVINDAYIKAHQGGRISESSGGAALPTYSSAPLTSQNNATSAINAPNVASVNRAAVEAENQRLRQEQARAGAEMDEPYGGNNGMEEDRAEQRSTQIPQQINRNSQQLNQRP
jgi:hypothetical protein